MKIVDACPHCEHHHSISPRAFKKEKKATEASLAKRLREDPNNPWYIREALDHWSKNHDPDNFEKMAAIYLSRAADNPDVIKTIAQGYFRLGQFQKSIEVAQKLPAGEESGREELIVTAQTQLEANATGKRKKWAFRIPLLVPYMAPLLLILSICWGIFADAIKEGQAREIWLVNGALTPYTVQIDGTDYPLGRRSTQAITLPMGTHTVQIVGLSPQLPSFTFTYDLSFGERMKDENTLVLNPDGLAVLLAEGIPYISESASSDMVPETRTRYYSGQTWYVLPDIDWPFTEAKNSIDMPDGTDVLYKNVLNQVKTATYTRRIEILKAIGKTDAIPAFIERIRQIEPKCSEIESLLKQINQ